MIGTVATMNKLEEKSDVTVDREMSKSSTEPSEHLKPSLERDVQLHVKTFLAVFAVLLIYFAQLVSLVGAGAVSFPSVSLTAISLFRSNGDSSNSKAKQSLLTSGRPQALSGSRGLLRYSRWF